MVFWVHRRRRNHACAGHGMIGFSFHVAAVRQRAMVNPDISTLPPTVREIRGCAIIRQNNPSAGHARNPWEAPERTHAIQRGIRSPYRLPNRPFLSRTTGVQEKALPATPSPPAPVLRQKEIPVRYPLHGGIQLRHFDLHVGIVAKKTFRPRTASQVYEECLAHWRIEQLGHVEIPGVVESPLLGIAQIHRALDRLVEQQRARPPDVANDDVVIGALYISYTVCP